MISFHEARRTILQALPTMSLETIELGDAYGRILAEDINAETDLPPFDNSSMDGYAIRAADSESEHGGRPVPLRIAGEIRAGETFAGVLAPGTAIRIMTGAPIPLGADTVIEQELVDVKDGMAGIADRVGPGRNIRKQGEEVRRGEVILRKGTRLTPAAVGLLASLGRGKVLVSAQPSVAFLTTGSELLEINEPLVAGKIRNSSAYTIRGLISDSGGKPVNLGNAGDDESGLRAKITEGLLHDVLITSGGISVGKHDRVLQTLTDVGVRVQFWKVNMKPGMPLAFGIAQRDQNRTVPVFALPGNTVSTVVTFLEFVRPSLARMCGSMEGSESLRLFATIEHDSEKKDAKRHFLRGIVRNVPSGFVVRTTGSQSSGILSSLVTANCLIVLPEDQRDLKKGDTVEIELL